MSAKDDGVLDLEETIKELGASENLQWSPVSFLIRNISDLLKGEKSPEAFARETIVATKNAQFYFKHMPQELRTQNLDAFDREFTLADKINEYIKAYMKMGDENKCSAECFSDAILSFTRKYIAETVQNLRGMN